MKKILKFGLITILVVFGLAVILKIALTGFLNDSLKDSVREQLGPDFNFNYEDLSLSLMAEHILLKDFKMGRHAETGSVWQLEVDKVEIKTFGIWDFIQNGDISIGTIEIIDPKVDFKKGSSLVLDTSRTYSTAPEIRLRLGEFVIKSGHVNAELEGALRINARLNLEIGGIDFRGNLPDMVEELGYGKLNLRDLTCTLPDSAYQLSAHNLTVNHAGEFIEIDSLKLRPLLSLAEFEQKHGWRKGMITLDFPSVLVSQPKNFGDSLYWIDKVEVDGFNARIQKDDRMPLPDRVTALPQELLSRFKDILHIGVIEARNGDFKLNITHEYGRISHIDLVNIQAQIIGLQNTNMEEPAFTLLASAVLMNETKLEIETAYMYGEHDPFTISGKLQSGNLSLLKDFLAKAAGLEVDQGDMHELSFNMAGNTYGIGGTLQFTYENLVLHAIDKDTRKDKTFMNAVSDIAGHLVYWKDNPGKERFRNAKFYAERDVRKAFISQWIDGIMKGILVSVSKLDLDKLHNIKEIHSIKKEQRVHEKALKKEQKEEKAREKEENK